MTQWFKLLLAVAVTLAAVPTGLSAGQSLRLEFGASAARSTASSLNTALGFGTRNTTTSSARLMWSESAGPFRFEVHGLLSAAKGGNVAYLTAAAPFVPATPPTTLLNLSRIFYADANTVVAGRLDRLSIGFTSAQLVVKVGRQAITWGTGMVFHPTDVVAPFAPNAGDTSYKTGVDMIYTQYLFDSGADIEVVAVPRAAAASGSVTEAASTFAVRFSTLFGSLDANVLLARDRGKNLAALSIGGALGGAAWSAEVVHYALAGNGRQTAYLANISNSGVVFDRNITYFAEYFHNPFGVASSMALDALPAALSARLGTGQLFTIGRDFLSLGAQVVLTPDLVIAPNAIISLNDYSAIVAVAANYTIDDNTDIIVLYQQPVGAGGSEFGGRETTAGSGIFATPSQQISLRLVRFF